MSLAGLLVDDSSVPADLLGLTAVALVACDEFDVRCGGAGGSTSR